MPLDALFKALGDETRREILRMLAKKEMTAGEIANVFNQSWPTISYHLKILKEAGLINDEKKRLHIIYAINTTVFQEILLWVYENINKREKKNE
jgi:DNA-binding transcriptional ArsR family regulator